MASDKNTEGEVPIHEVQERIGQLEDEVRKLREIILDLTKDLPKTTGAEQQ